VNFNVRVCCRFRNAGGNAGAVEQVAKAEARGKRAFMLVVVIVIPIYGSPWSTHSVLFIVLLSVDGSVVVRYFAFSNKFTQTFSQARYYRNSFGPIKGLGKKILLK
jgi:hypothetical protein